VKFNVRNVLPANTAEFNGFRLARWLTVPFLVVAIVRSCIHLFSADGGAQSIAGIDIAVEGGNNIIALFHQWGAIQLILALVLTILFVRYPGLTPLVLLALVADPILRDVAGQIMPVTSTTTPPGAALNAPVFFAVSLLFVLSLFEHNPSEKVTIRTK
jgi:hypothetical protein